MTEGQWVGVFLAAVGAYLFVVATWKRDFVLYRLKTRRVQGLLGEKGSHIFFQILGLGLLTAGVLQALKIWVV
jgi:hypothetical protein